MLQDANPFSSEPFQHGQHAISRVMESPVYQADPLTDSLVPQRDLATGTRPRTKATHSWFAEGQGHLFESGSG